VFLLHDLMNIYLARVFFQWRNKLTTACLSEYLFKGNYTNIDVIQCYLSTIGENVQTSSRKVTRFFNINYFLQAMTNTFKYFRIVSGLNHCVDYHYRIAHCCIAGSLNWNCENRLPSNKSLWLQSWCIYTIIKPINLDQAIVITLAMN